jgi:uncharacterized protein YoxC
MANDKPVQAQIEVAASEAAEEPAAAVEQVAEQIETHDAEVNPVIQAVAEMMKGVVERLDRIEASVNKHPKTAKKEGVSDGIQIKEEKAGGGGIEDETAKVQPEQKPAPARSKRIRFWRTL